MNSAIGLQCLISTRVAFKYNTHSYLLKKRHEFSHWATIKFAGDFVIRILIGYKAVYIWHYNDRDIVFGMALFWPFPHTILGICEFTNKIVVINTNCFIKMISILDEE